MAKRYYLCNIIGDGSDDNPFRPAVADYDTAGVSWSGVFQRDPSGRPIHADCLVIVDTEDHSLLRRDAHLDPMPDFSLDGKMSAINKVVKTAMTNALKRRGFDVSGITNTDGYREALQQIGMQRSGAFDIDKLDVS